MLESQIASPYILFYNACDNNDSAFQRNYLRLEIFINEKINN